MSLILQKPVPFHLASTEDTDPDQGSGSKDITVLLALEHLVYCQHVLEGGLDTVLLPEGQFDLSRRGDRDAGLVNGLEDHPTVEEDEWGRNEEGKGSPQDHPSIGTPTRELPSQAVKDEGCHSEEDSQPDVWVALEPVLMWDFYLCGHSSSIADS